MNKAGTALSGRALNRHNAWAAVRKRARNAGFLTPVGCHTWRATGVTVYLENGGRLEHAQQMAAHESPEPALRTAILAAFFPISLTAFFAMASAGPGMVDFSWMGLEP